VARVYYVGDWAVLTGPVFAETPFHYSHKGLDIFNYGHWLKSALEATGEHEVASKLFQLAPSFFDRSKSGAGPLTFPDRIRLTLEAVRSGKGLMLLGGWYSFTGEMGKGGWGRASRQPPPPRGMLSSRASTSGPCPPSWATTRHAAAATARSSSRSRRRATRCWPSGPSARAVSSLTRPTPRRTGA
jgi:hypothetical protein